MEMPTTPSSTNLRNKYYYIFLSLLLLFFFLKQTPRFDYVDYGVYGSYAVSLVEDGNLNISDELYEIRKQRGEAVIQTPTNYDPDFHSHGSSFIFTPFVILSKLFEDTFRITGESSFMKLPWVISHKRFVQENFIGIALNLSLLVGLFLIFKVFNGFRQQLFAMFLLVFATPLYMYSIFLPGNANLLCFPLFGFLYKKLYEKKFQLKFNEVLYVTSFISILFIIKANAFFLSLLIPFILYKSRLKVKEISLSLIPVLFVFILYLINRYIQYGTLHIGYGGITSQFIPLKMLFDPFSGFFYTSPIFPLLLVLYFFKGSKDWCLGVLVSLIVARYVVVSFTFDSGIDFGDRASINELYIWALLLRHAFVNYKRSSLYILLSGCLVWTVFLAIFYLQLPFKQDHFFYFKNYMANSWHALSYCLNYVKTFNFYFIKVITIPIAVGLFFALKNTAKWKKHLPYYLIFCYLLVTSLNYMNRSNTTIYDDAIVTDDVKAWYSLENI